MRFKIDTKNLPLFFDFIQHIYSRRTDNIFIFIHVFQISYTTIQIPTTQVFEKKLIGHISKSITYLSKKL